MVGLVIIGVVNTEGVTQLVLSRAAQLAAIPVARSDAPLQRLREAWGVLLPSDAAHPTWIILTREGARYPEPPLPIGGKRPAALAGFLAPLGRPPLGNLLADLGPLTSSKGWLRLTRKYGAHVRLLLGRALIRRLALAALSGLRRHRPATSRAGKLLGGHRLTPLCWLVAAYYKLVTVEDRLCVANTAPADVVAIPVVAGDYAPVSFVVRAVLDVNDLAYQFACGLLLHCRLLIL